MKIKLVFLIVGVVFFLFALSSYASAADDTTETASTDGTATINGAERPYTKSIQNDYPRPSGPCFQRMATGVLPFMNKLTPEEAKNMAGTTHLFGDGIEITGSYLHKGKVPLADCAQIVKIRAVNEEEKVTGEGLVVGLIGEATKDWVPTVRIVGAMAYSVWERGGGSLVFTAEGCHRVINVSVSSFRLGYIWGGHLQSGHYDYPFLQGGVATDLAP